MEVLSFEQYLNGKKVTESSDSNVEKVIDYINNDTESHAPSFKSTTEFINFVKKKYKKGTWDKAVVSSILRGVIVEAIKNSKIEQSTKLEDEVLGLLFKKMEV